MSLQENLEKLDSEELVYKLAQKSLTDEAEAIAIAILQSRGVKPPISSEIKNIEIEHRPLHIVLANLLADIFKGKASLKVAFWGVGLALYLIVIGIGIGYEITRQQTAGVVFSFFLVIFLLLGNPIHAYCIWKCRKNCKNEFFILIAGLYSFAQILIWVFIIPLALIIS
jgi:hypothetical protein